MGEETSISTSTSTSTSSQEISAPKIVAFIGILVLCQESVLALLNGVGLDILFGILGIIIAIVIFLSLKFIDLGPVKLPYYWWLTLIFGILFIGLAWTTNPGVAGTFGGAKPYLGGVLLCIAGLTEILAEKKNILHSKLTAIVGAGFGIYEAINMFILYTGIVLLNAVIGIIAAVILIIIVLDLIDIKIPYEWWVVLTLGFIIFTWVSPFFAGIGGIVIMISFILLILGH